MLKDVADAEVPLFPLLKTAAASAVKSAQHDHARLPLGWHRRQRNSARCDRVNGSPRDRVDAVGLRFATGGRWRVIVELETMDGDHADNQRRIEIVRRAGRHAAAVGAA
jgi:hypothetical protein